MLPPQLPFGHSLKGNVVVMVCYIKTGQIYMRGEAAKGHSNTSDILKVFVDNLSTPYFLWVITIEKSFWDTLFHLQSNVACFYMPTRLIS